MNGASVVPDEVLHQALQESQKETRSEEKESRFVQKRKRARMKIGKHKGRLGDAIRMAKGFDSTTSVHLREYRSTHNPRRDNKSEKTLNAYKAPRLR